MAELLAGVAAGGELRRLLEVRVPELVAFQDVRYARRYRELGAGARVQVMLHPPLVRALGLRRKLAISGAAAMRALARAKRLRGTPLDPFGGAHVRRVERARRTSCSTASSASSRRQGGRRERSRADTRSRRSAASVAGGSS